MQYACVLIANIQLLCLVFIIYASLQHTEPILDQYVISHRRLRLYFPAKTRL